MPRGGAVSGKGKYSYYVESKALEVTGRPRKFLRASGAELLVAPCANCKKQLREVCEDNGLEDVKVVGLHDLLVSAIDLGAKGPEDGKDA